MRNTMDVDASIQGTKRCESYAVASTVIRYHLHRRPVEDFALSIALQHRHHDTT